METYLIAFVLFCLFQCLSLAIFVSDVIGKQNRSLNFGVALYFFCAFVLFATDKLFNFWQGLAYLIGLLMFDVMIGTIHLSE